MEHISGLLIGQLKQGQASDWLTLRTPLIIVSSSHKYGNVTWLDLVTDMFYSCNGQNTGGWWILQCHFAQMSPLRWHARYKPSHRWGECHISSVVSSSFVHAFSKINTKLSHFHSSSKYVHIDKRVWICNQGDHDETRGASQRKRAGGLKLLIPECMYVLQSQPQCMKITKKVSFYSMWRWK